MGNRILRCWQIQLARSFALFFALFTLANLAGEIWFQRFDANLWWLDLRFLPSALSRSVLLASALVLLVFAIRPPMKAWQRASTAIFAGVLAIVAISNGAQFYLLLMKGAIASGLPIAFSLFVAAALGCIVLCSVRGESAPVRRFEGIRGVLLTIIWAAMFPLLQTVCFGKTDYTRHADAAVVFGARAYADGRASDALADRVRTACDLYKRGIVRKLIFSGGPGDGAVSETEAMRRLALSLQVNDDDIVLDPEGLNTERTVRNSIRICNGLNANRVLAVSHFYHLPRIKLAYQKYGWEVYTVPAKETYFLRQTPYSVAREVVAFWAYYFREVG